METEAVPRDSVEISPETGHPDLVKPEQPVNLNNATKQI